MSVITIVDSTEFFSPPTLQELCTGYCSSNASWLLFKKVAGNKFSIQKTVRLPNQIWQDVIDKFDHDTDDIIPMVSEIVLQVNLNKINVSNCAKLSDDHLRTIMKLFPVSLDIHNCQQLTKQALVIINELGKNLECLIFGNSTHIIPTDIHDSVIKQIADMNMNPTSATGIRTKVTESLSRFLNGSKTKDAPEETEKPKPGILRLPKLRKLVIWGHCVHQIQNVDPTATAQAMPVPLGGGDNNGNGGNVVDYWELLTRDFIGQLEYLDLSGCHEVKCLAFLMKATATLKSLHLHDVLLEYDDRTWGALKHFTNLRYLDVSQYNELASVFPNPDATLESLVTALPNLVGLDISGSNLAGFGSVDATSCSIKGLKSRKEKNKWLQFLGLLASHYNASSRDLIPAFRVAGNADTEQLLISLKSYLHRGNMVRKTVRILHERLLSPNFADFVPSFSILDSLAEVIQRHLHDKHTLIISFATMFQVLKRVHESELGLGSSRRAKLIYYTNKAVGIHFQDLGLLRNGILNIHLLSLKMKLPHIRTANTLYPNLLKAGKIALESAQPTSFFLQSISRLMDTIMDPNRINLITTVDCVSETCSLVKEMMKKKIEPLDITAFWRLLLKWLGLATDDELCTKFVNSDGVEAAFELMGLCVAEDLPENSPFNCLLTPVVALLANLLANFPKFETKIVTSSHALRILEVLRLNKNLNEQELRLLRHVCCGLIATMICKKSSDGLKADPSRAELIESMFKCMTENETTALAAFDYKSVKPLYNLLEARDFPEAHLWALQTLLILMKSKDGKRVLEELEKDGKIKVKTLQSKFVRADLSEELKGAMRRVCSRLESIATAPTDI